MTTMTGYERWQAGIDKAVGDTRWNIHDCEIIRAVNEINHHLSGQGGYLPLDWRIIKAMIWVETGAAHSAWKVKPMQIGVADDPGLDALITGDEGGALILPPAWRKHLSRASITTMPAHNIRAGIAYLLMRMAYFTHSTVLDADTGIYEIKVKPGDSFYKIANAQNSTVALLKQLNPGATMLQPGQILKYKKGNVRRIVTGWRPMSAEIIAQRYNGGGDPNYPQKLKYVLNTMHHRKAGRCAQ